MILEIANETGSSGHKHAHVMFQLHKKWDSSDPRCFDYCGEHPNIKPLLGRYAMIDTAKYLAKDDPENKDLVQRTTDFIMELNKNQIDLIFNLFLLLQQKKNRKKCLNLKLQQFAVKSIL